MHVETAADLRYLQGKGTSLGGLRPKCTVIDRNDSVKKMRLFIDGVKVQDTDLGTNQARHGKLILGGSGFDGFMDEFRASTTARM